VRQFETSWLRHVQSNSIVHINNPDHLGYVVQKKKEKKERSTDTMIQQMASIELEMSDFSPVSFSHQNKYCRELHGIYPVRQPLRRMSVLPFLPSFRCNIESPARLGATRGWRSKIAFASHRARVRAAYSGREKRA